MEEEAMKQGGFDSILHKTSCAGTLGGEVRGHHFAGVMDTKVSYPSLKTVRHRPVNASPEVVDSIKFSRRFQIGFTAFTGLFALLDPS
jgi:hypothetical protein